MESLENPSLRDQIPLQVFLRRLLAQIANGAEGRLLFFNRQHDGREIVVGEFEPSLASSTGVSRYGSSFSVGSVIENFTVGEDVLHIK